MNQPTHRSGARLLAGLALTLSTAGCTFEEVRCAISFETDAMPGLINTWVTQECTADVYPGLTVLHIQQGGQSIEVDIIGPLSVGVHDIEIEYRDGSSAWSHDGNFDGVGPQCQIVLETAQVEEWTQVDRVRMSGTIECPGKLTTSEDQELAFVNASFTVFAKDEYFLGI